MPYTEYDNIRSRDKFSVGQTVEFGRENGEWTRGIIVKMNSSKAKVQTTTPRGHGRGSAVGNVWSVPYFMMRPVSNETQTPPDVSEVAAAYQKLSDKNKNVVMAFIQKALCAS